MASCWAGKARDGALLGAADQHVQISSSHRLLLETVVFTLITVPVNLSDENQNALFEAALCALPALR